MLCLAYDQLQLYGFLLQKTPFCSPEGFVLG